MLFIIKLSSLPEGSVFSRFFTVVDLSAFLELYFAPLGFSDLSHLCNVTRHILFRVFLVIVREVYARTTLLTLMFRVRNVYFSTK